MKKNILTVALPVLLCSFATAFGQSCPKWGPYITAKFNKPEAADLFMSDVMIPPEGNTAYTYTCAVQFGIGKSGGYCGLQNNNGDGERRRPLNNIFSVWDFPNKIQLQASYQDAINFVGGFGGEGTGLHSHADFGWVPGQWYTNVVRRWYTGGDKTQVGYFIFDQTAKEWKHYVTFAVPEADAKLHGNHASFLENFADNQKRSRISCYRNYWQLTTDNKWVKADSLVAGAGEGYWNAEAIGTNGVRLTACGPEFLKKDQIAFPVTGNEAMPDFIQPVDIYEIGGYYDKAKKGIYVDWTLRASGSPQLSYEVALFDNRACQGEPLASLKGTDPDLRSLSMPTPMLSTEKKTYYVLLTLKDIFNQTGKSKKLELRDMHP